MKKMTISEAVHEWVREFNAYPQDMVQILMEARPEDWEEVTEPCLGDRVYCYLPITTSEGEVSDIYDDGDGNVKYEIKLDDNSKVDCERDDFEVRYDYVLPIWGTMWSLSDPTDKYWLEEMDGIRKMSECGFRVYKNEEWGYFFGIDGAGYSFYEAHWTPLYKARGLKWHDEDDESECGC